MQFQSDMIGVPVERPACIETTALGAACLAGLSAGVWSGLDELKADSEGLRRFEPALSAEAREAALAGWHCAVDRVRSGKR